MTVRSNLTHSPVVLDHAGHRHRAEPEVPAGRSLVPGVAQHPLQKLATEPAALLRRMERWRAAAPEASKPIERVAVADAAGGDGFWLARWLRHRGIECHVIHPTPVGDHPGVAVSREGRRARTDRRDSALLMRAFVGWVRGEGRMVAIPTLAEKHGRRPNLEHEQLTRERRRSSKATLPRLGLRPFKPKLKRASERSAQLRPPDEAPIPQGRAAA